MKGFLSDPDSELYDNDNLKKHLKNVLRTRFIFSEGEGLDDIVMMREQV